MSVANWDSVNWCSARPSPGPSVNGCTPRALRVSLASAVVLAACGAHRSSIERLEESLLFYHTHLKAQDVERAAAYVAPEAVADFNALHNPDLNVFVIEDFSIATMTEVPDTERIVVVVRANVRKRDSLTIRTVRLREVWEKRGGRWLLVEEKMLAPDALIEGGGEVER